MANQFAEEYAQSIANLIRYNAAKASNDEAAIQEVVKAHRELEAHIEAKGTAYAHLYSKYESAQERGNALIDWDEVIQDKDVSSFVANLREYGIEKFVFSSTWSSAVETAWLFQQNGCKLEGLVEINGRVKGICSDEREKIHGYLFSL